MVALLPVRHVLLRLGLPSSDWLLLAAALVAAPPGTSFAATDYFVANNGNDAWSGKFAVPGGADGPLRTLAAAQARVRSQIAAGMGSDVNVFVRAGEYPETSLYFTAADAGRSGYRITWQNYPGERPLVHAGRRLTGWQPADAGVYRTSVAGIFHTLYENGQRSVKARHPNRVDDGSPPAYSRTTAAVAGDDLRRFGFGAGGIPFVANASELEVVLWPAGPQGIWNWAQYTFTVDAIDWGARVLTLGRDTCCGLAVQTDWPISVGSRYFVQGGRELLDEAGEFWLGNGQIYYRPRRTPIEAQTIIAPGPSSASVFSLTAEVPTAFNIGIEGLEIGYTDRNQHAISLFNAGQVSIKGNHLFSLGGHGIAVSGGADNVVIEGNLIHEVGFDGIAVYGERSIGNPSQLTIRNNYVHHTGRLRGDSNGITLGRGSRTTIAHNRIHDVPRAGIRLYGSAFETPPTYDAAANVVAYNDVSRAVTDSQDSGLIHLSGVGPGTLIDSNRFHDSDLPFSYGEGIYLDVCNLQAKLTNNLIDGLQMTTRDGITFAGMHIKGADIEISNNFVVRNRLSRGSINVNVVDTNCLTLPTRSVTIKRNVLADNGPARLYVWSAFDPQQLATADLNLFHDINGRYEIGYGLGNSQTEFSTSKQTLQEWRRTQGTPDAGSLTADPRFVDPANQDYRLHPDSPALTLGVRDIDVEAIGLTSAFPFADHGEATDRLFIKTALSGSSATLRIAEGSSTPLVVSARTRSGYLVPLPNAGLLFSSDQPQVADVDALGKVTGRAPGFATLTVSNGSVSNPKASVLLVAVRGRDDCLFDWAEDKYPDLFRPARPVSRNAGPYLYRYYGATGAYLGTSSADSHLYYLGPASGGLLVDLGPVAGWASLGGCG